MRSRNKNDIFNSHPGFSIVELMVTAVVMGIVAAFAVPQAVSALKGYRLHADATAIASFVNQARMNAGSQYAPYRLVINVAAGTYWIEKLCGITTVGSDPACTSAYAPFSVPVISSGKQYILSGDTYWSCRPTFMSNTTFPGTISADPSPCPDPVYFYFNTRTMPVNSTGNPLTNGGTVIYIANQNNLVEAVTTSLGGSATTWLSPANGTSWSTQ